MFVKRIWTFRVIAIALLVYFIVPSTLILVRLRWRVASLLGNARTIALEEFQGFRHPKVLTSVTLLPGTEADSVLAAMPYAPDAGFPSPVTGCAFHPHHRIVIVARDGTAVHLNVCFGCEALSLRDPGGNHAPVIAMPFAWGPGLRRLFKNHGFVEHAHYNDFDPPEQAGPSAGEPSAAPTLSVGSAERAPRLSGADR